MTRKEVGGNVQTLRNSLWLAGKEMRRTWISYFATGLFVLFFGFLGSVNVENLFQVEGAGGQREAFANAVNSYTLDIYFLAVIPLTAGNFLSRDYFSSWRDSFSTRLSFLRALPILPEEMVIGRVLNMLPALVLTDPAFFLPVCLLSRRLREQIDPVQYLWFAAVWISYAILVAGLYLYLEMSVSGKTYNLLMAPAIAFFFALPALTTWGLDLRIVAGTVGLVQSYGPIPAIVALLIGGAGLLLWVIAATRRLKRRNL